MSSLLKVSLLYLHVAFAGFSQAQQSSNPFPSGQATSDPLVVDLGYATYQGVSTGLNAWYGIPYAEAPVGPLRWQLPVPPNSTSNGTILDASSWSYICPQSSNGVTGMPPFSPNGGENEDCLTLNVWATPNATDLPVFVWIHGGGYGGGSSHYDIPFLINSSKDKFIGVSIQYRLGAFGFLSSDDVHQFGTPNAGLYDQYLALQWVQNYIGLFGGNASQVTLAGESAGAGAVMLQSMAYGGQTNDTLFSRVMIASPYLPQQYNYSDFAPSQSYYAFAEAAGCFNGPTSARESIFNCLVEQDTITLQNASYTVTINAEFGKAAFLPVTDGVLVENHPSAQLPTGLLNGKQALIGNNADEGEMFVPQTITTEQDFIDYVEGIFPLFDDSDVQQVLTQYPISTTQEANQIRFATSGIDNTTTAVTEGPFATGQQQRANNLYAEVTFTCPAQWLAEGFSINGHQSFKYQYSIISALHGDDLFAYFNYTGSLPNNMAQTYRDSVVSFINSFIVTGNPTTQTIYNSTVPPDTAKILASWPTYSLDNPIQINLNQTGGVLTTGTDPRDPFGYQIDIYVDPGLQPDFSLVNAYTWEGGRGNRCDFWKSMGAKVPG